jgi:hypothetical protein
MQLSQDVILCCFRIFITQGNGSKDTIGGQGLGISDITRQEDDVCDVGFGEEGCPMGDVVVKHLSIICFDEEIIHDHDGTVLGVLLPVSGM